MFKRNYQKEPFAEKDHILYCWIK